MAYLPGFNYVSGPRRFQWSTVSSTCTARRGTPLTLDALGHLILADSDSTAIYGIAANDAADSIPGVLSQRLLVEIPEPETVYAVRTDPDAVASNLTLGRSYGIQGYLTMYGNSTDSVLFYQLDTDSQVTTFLTLVGNQLGGAQAAVVSDDSTVFVRWLANRLGVFSSGASISGFAQL